MKIVNFGSLNIDRVYQVEHLVRPGETITSLNYQIPKIAPYINKK